MTAVLIILITDLRSALAEEPDTARHSVYVVKYSWHTGFLLEVNEYTLKTIKVFKQFRDYKYVDIGWGDEDFYQYPGSFDLWLAAKAILFPTTSAVRAKGVNHKTEDYEIVTDWFLKFTMTNEEFKVLCRFIDNSFRVKGDSLIQTSSRQEGRIRFFKSGLMYHLFRTCNTWVAKGLEFSGINAGFLPIITAESLYSAIKDQAEIIKIPEE